MAHRQRVGYTAHETRNFAASMGLAVCTTPVQSPEINGMAEGFVKTFKRDYVHVNRLENARAPLGLLGFVQGVHIAGGDMPLYRLPDYRAEIVGVKWSASDMILRWRHSDRLG